MIELMEAGYSVDVIPVPLRDLCCEGGHLGHEVVRGWRGCRILSCSLEIESRSDFFPCGLLLQKNMSLERS